MRISERIKLWRDDAAVLRRRGARRAAALLERVAAELEEDVRGAAEGATLDDAPELVEMRAAVALSGYTRGHLRRMLVAGTLTNSMHYRHRKPQEEKEEPGGCSPVFLCNRRTHAQ